MNRVINDPNQVTEDSLAGVLRAHPDLLVATDHPRVLRSAAPAVSRVGVVTGGGSGHEPAFLGYVGPGLVDAVAVGEVFASPTAKSFHAAFREADRGQGVACLYGNYAGDNMNVKMAVKLAAKDGIRVETVVANDDVASAPADETDKPARRRRRDPDVEGGRGTGRGGRRPRRRDRFGAQGDREHPLDRHRPVGLHHPG